MRAGEPFERRHFTSGKTTTWAVLLAAGLGLPLFSGAAMAGDSCVSGTTGLGTGTASGPNAWACGTGAQANNSVTVGPYGSTATGISSTATGDGSTATGAFSQATGSFSAATGANSKATGYGATAAGTDSLASGASATATGSVSEATGDYSTATGAASAALANASTATGWSSLANAENSTATGASSSATGVSSSAFGQGAVASGANSTAIGQGASAGFDNSTAIGSGVSTTRANQVAIGGSGSTYTLAGLASPASNAAQSGSTFFVTTDSAGNLGTSSFSLDTINALDGRVAGLESEVGSVNRYARESRREARGGIAAAMAMTSAPMPSAPGRTSWATNYANFKGSSGFGAAVAYRLDTTASLALTAGYSYGGDDNHGFRVGMQGEF